MVSLTTFLFLFFFILQINTFNYSRQYYSMFINQTRLLIRSSSISYDQSLILIVELSGTVSIGKFKNSADLSQGFTYSQSLIAPAQTINVADFSKNNELIVSGGKDMYIRLWKYNSNTGLYDPYQNISIAHNLSITNVFFFPDSNYLISAALQENVTKIWKLNPTTGLYQIYQIIQHKYTLISSNFFPNLMKIGSSCINSTVEIWLWNATTLKFQLNYTHYDPNFTYLVGSQIFTLAILTHNGTQLIVVAYYLKGIIIYIWNESKQKYEYAYKYNLTQNILSYGLSRDENTIAFNSQQSTYVYILNYSKYFYVPFILVNNANANDSSNYFPNRIFFSNNSNILICSDVLYLKIYSYGCKISDYYNQTDQLCHSGCNILNINTTLPQIDGKCNCATNYTYFQEHQACIWNCQNVPNSIVDNTYTYQFQNQISGGKIQCLCANQFNFIVDMNACVFSCKNIVNSPGSNKDINSCNCYNLYKWNPLTLLCELNITLIIIICMSIIIGIMVLIGLWKLMSFLKTILVRKEREKKQLRIIPQQTIRKDLKSEISPDYNLNESDFQLKMDNSKSLAYNEKEK